MMRGQRYRRVARYATLAIALCASACARPAEKPAAATTSIPISLRARDNMVVRIGTPMPSLPPLTPAQEALVKWRERGWYEIASTNDRVYTQSQSGLQALRASDASVVWRNPKCKPGGATLSIIGDELFTVCTPGFLSVLNANTGRILQTAPVRMDGINSVAVAGKEWLAVQGWSGGAALVNILVILRRNTLQPINDRPITDGTFLGVIGDRAYIDDWCCHGRADEYRPATIYSISLRDGTQSAPVDLRPDPNRHPANLQPLGQGEHNYMQGHYLYVPVDDVLYRYDILHLRLPPKRTRIPAQPPPRTPPPANTQ